MIKIETLTSAMEAAEIEVGGNIGIRALHADEFPVVGQVMPESHTWEDDVRSDTSIGGTAAFREAADAVSYSYSTRFAIISGQDIGSAGMPEKGARAFRNAEVVAIIEF